MDPIDFLVLGAGWRGLAATLRLSREHPAASIRLIDGAAQPGGSIRSQRSNGFVCELGPFAFARPEVEPLLALLQRPPAIVDAQVEAGSLFDGRQLVPMALAPRPVSFASGCEELPQACRRELGSVLWLGRAVQTIVPAGDRWEIELGGEVPTRVLAKNLLVCLPLWQSAALLAGLDPALAEVASRVQREARAFAFLGGLESDFTSLTGYGIVPAEDVVSPVVETIFCSRAFAQRCLPNRFLLRSELVGTAAAGADDDVIATATAELYRWTGCIGSFGFTRVHRFESAVRDGSWAECRVRLQGLASRSASLQFP